MKRILLPLLTLLAGLFVPPASAAFDLFGKRGEPELLEPEKAFVLRTEQPGADTVLARWRVAEGYYLYRERIRVEPSPGVRVLGIETPAGESKDDPNFGRMEVYHRDAAQALIRLAFDAPRPADATITLEYQGCAEIGVCYPPMRQRIALGGAGAAGTSAATPAAGGAEPDQDRLARLLTEHRLWALPTFFGLGLLLAFTPCVFPMIPILSGVIAGQGKPLTRRRGFLLAAVYVLAMAATYTVAGVLAAHLGQNLQALFQNPWVITGFAALFVLLAASMFGLYELQMPAWLQTRLAALSHRQRGGEYLGVAAMGLLSALIVGPCVAPPLIGALAVIAQTGDTLAGGAALFALSLGMGAPLLAVGASAGHFLPRAGHWMERVKAVFGVGLIAVALLMLERIVPAWLAMAAWAVLLIVCATYMGALSVVPHGAPSWRTLVKGLGLVLLIQGALLLIGVAAGGREVWRPLAGLTLVGGPAAEAGPAFRPVKTVAELGRAIADAGGRLVMLDVYADWCVSCKELERDTFPAPAVRAALADAVLLRADVTANDAEDQALLKRFGLYGPPAILFFGADGTERRASRVIGYQGAEAFAATARRARSG